MKIAVKILDNGQTYIDKDFLNRRGIDAVNRYGYTIIEIDDNFNDCIEEDFDGLYFNSNKYYERKQKSENQDKIFDNLKRMNELSKDFIQAYLGASIPNLDIKKQEFVRLHNEVRSYLGKEPRVYYLS